MVEKLTLVRKLVKVQNELKAPKNQYNSFGRYSYRSCEDILEAVKPVIERNGLTTVLSDEIVQVGERVYVKATATVTDGDDSITVTAYAREEEDKKGMDKAQITGSASSYARKYALNGLFLIDDNKDADTDEHANETKGKSAKQQSKRQPPAGTGKTNTSNEQGVNAKEYELLFQKLQVLGVDKDQMIDYIVKQENVNNISEVPMSKKFGYMKIIYNKKVKETKQKEKQGVSSEW